MPKTIEQSFADWEGSAFGLGYGSGEPHVLPALKAFFAAFGRDDLPNAYEYKRLEAAVTPPVAWLLINALGKAGVIEWGTSARYGWLTPHGDRLKAFVDAHTADQLVEICCSQTEDDFPCYPNACNCGPNGYEEGRKCGNPFWK